MLKIYGIKNCNSMKKAFDLLTDLGLSYEFHDYKKQGIDATTVKHWLDTCGQDLILNKKAPLGVNSANLNNSKRLQTKTI